MQLKLYIYIGLSMKRKYDVLNKLNLLSDDENDELMKIATSPNIFKKIKKKRKYLKLCYQTYNHNAKVIQRFFRKHIAYKHFLDLKHKTQGNYNQYINNTTLLGVTIVNIPSQYFYYFESSKLKHAFDIRELKKIIDLQMNHPYTNQPIPISIKKQINRIIFKLNSQGISTLIYNFIPKQSLISSKISELHHTFLILNVYTNFDKLYKFQIQDYEFLLEDLLENNLLKNIINQKLFNKIKYYYSLKHTNKKIINKLLSYILFFFESLINVKDIHQSTRALAISEILDAYRFE